MSEIVVFAEAEGAVKKNQYKINMLDFFDELRVEVGRPVAAVVCWLRSGGRENDVLNILDLFGSEWAAVEALCPPNFKELKDYAAMQRRIQGASVVEGEAWPSDIIATNDRAGLFRWVNDCRTEESVNLKIHLRKMAVNEIAEIVECLWPDGHKVNEILFYKILDLT